MREEKILAALGLAQKAGKLASGDTAVQTAVKAGKAKLLLVAADAAKNSRKNMFNMAASFAVPVYGCLGRRSLGGAIGKAERTAVAVLDKGFAVMIEKEVKGIGER